MSTTEPQQQTPPTQQTTHLLPSPFTNTHPTPSLLTQGAEALVYKTHFLTPSQPAILKFRPSKAYRHPTLDARLTKQRVLAEARVLVKLSAPDVRDAGVRVPGVLALEWDVARKVKGTGVEVERVRREGAASGAWILMEFVEGKTVKELLRAVSVKPTVDQINVRDCCVVPKSLILYAKDKNIELLTHNDCMDILPCGTTRELLGPGPNGAHILASKADAPESEPGLKGNIEPQWVVKYTAVVKDRGVVENKGYYAVAQLGESEDGLSSQAKC